MAKNKKNKLPIDDFMNEKNIITLNIADACKDYSRISGANKNLYRIAPLSIDGLKPVARRTLYTFYMDYFKKKKFAPVKIATWSGAALRFHPHGNTSIYETIVGLARPWENNVPLIQGSGNYGNISGDPAGADRYINGAISKFAYKCFFENFEREHVVMKPTYSGDETEPVYLPARYPYLLLNGILGIGYGEASNIPPYNLTEVLEATMALLEDPNAKFVLVPDFPTGASVIDRGEFKDITETGVGTVRSRAVVEVNDRDNILTVRNIPYMTTMDAIKMSIVSAIDEKKYPQIERYWDNTNDENGVEFSMKLTRETNAKKFLKKLYKGGHGLEKTYPIDLNVVKYSHSYSFKHMSIREFLLDWIRYRRNHIASSLNSECVSRKEELIIEEIIKYVSDPNVKDSNGVSNAEKILKMYQKSANRFEIEQKLLDTFKKIPHWDDFKNKKVMQPLTTLQARTISSMSLTRFLKDEREKCIQNCERLMVRIKELMKIILDPKGPDTIIREQLKEGIELFGTPRQSHIIKDKKESSIPDVDRIVVALRTGLIQKINPKDALANIPSTVPIYPVQTNDVESVLVFDNEGNVGKIPVHEIPYSKNGKEAVPIQRFVKVPGDVVNVLAYPGDGMYLSLQLLLVTKFGFVKRVDVTEFKDFRTVSKVIGLQPGDELVGVGYVAEDSSLDVILSTNEGRGWRIDIHDIPLNKKSARGSQFGTLPIGENVVSVDLIVPSTKYMFYMTSRGRGKVTDLAYFPRMKKRREEPLPLIPLEARETLVSIASCTKKDEFVARLKNGGEQRIKVSDVPITGRQNKPTKLFPVPKGDAVVKLFIVR